MNSDSVLQNNLLIKLLKTISNEEWKKFEKFVASPYFNEGRNYIPLLKILKKYHPKFEGESFTKENIYERLLPGKKYKEGVLSSMFSRLYSIGEKYLVNDALDKNDHIVKELLISRELGSRGEPLKLNKLIDGKIKHLKEKKFGSLDFKNLVEIESEAIRLNWENDRGENIYETSIDLMKYSMYNYFFDWNINRSSLYSNKSFWKEDFEDNFLSSINKHINFEEILKLIKNSDYKNSVPIRLAYLSYMATRYPEKDEYYFEMKSLYMKESENFEQNFKNLMLNNLWAISAMKQKPDFRHEGFEIRKIMLEENIFTLHGAYMKIGDFRSTFINSMNVNQLEWGEYFLNNYLDKVPPRFRTEIKNYCMAWLSLAKGEFDNAIEYGGKVKLRQIVFKLDLKNIFSRVYYETNSTEPLYSLLDAYIQLTAMKVFT